MKKDIQVMKVIADNGYKLELIRPFRQELFNPGETVNVDYVEQSSTDLRKLFDNVLTDDVKDAILNNLVDAKKDVEKKRK